MRRRSRRRRRSKGVGKTVGREVAISERTYNRPTEHRWNETGRGRDFTRSVEEGRITFALRKHRTELLTEAAELKNRKKDP
jgi:hypothetical protein